MDSTEVSPRASCCAIRRATKTWTANEFTHVLGIVLDFVHLPHYTGSVSTPRDRPAKHNPGGFTPGITWSQVQELHLRRACTISLPLDTTFRAIRLVDAASILFCEHAHFLKNNNPGAVSGNGFAVSSRF